MQDWNYEQTGCMEITIELSDIKYPNAMFLPTFWDQNREVLNLVISTLIHHKFFKKLNAN